MSQYISTLKDEDGNVLLPRTTADAVSGFDVNTLSPLINQWDEKSESGYYSSSDGSKQPSSSQIRTANLIPLKPNTAYYFHADSLTNMNFRFFGSDKSFVSGTSATHEFTTASNVYYLGISFGATYGTTYNHDVSVNYPSSFTGYHPAKLSEALAPFGDLLWTNASPTSSFAAQTVSVDLSNYGSILVIGASCASSVGKKQDTYNTRIVSPSSNRLAWRDYKSTSSGVQFFDGQKTTTYGSASGTDNAVCIPYQIYGIK